MSRSFIYSSSSLSLSLDLSIDLILILIDIFASMLSSALSALSALRAFDAINALGALRAGRGRDLEPALRAGAHPFGTTIKGIGTATTYRLPASTFLGARCPVQ